MYGTMFSSFLRYDDEGTLLVSTRDFLHGGGLYEEVFSAYGPFYFLYEFVSHAAGALPVTHDLNRLFTIGEWSAAVLLIGWVAFALTASPPAAAAACVLAIPTVTGLSREPGHPQGLLLVLVSAVVLTGVRLMTQERHGWRYFVTGALVAAIALTKINSGIFVALALAIALLPRVRSSWSGFAAFAVTGAAIILPAVLMRTHLTSWAGPYCIVTTAALISIVVVSSPPTRSAIGLDRTKWLLAGAALCATATFAFILLRGTSAGELVMGWIVVPARISLSFQIPAPIASDAIPGAVLSIVVAVAWRLLTQRQRDGTARLFLLVKGLLAVNLIASVLIDPSGGGPRLAYFAPFLWVVLIPPPRRVWSIEELFARELLCLVAALQTMMAYPIAGSQVQSSVFFMLPVAVVCAADAVAAIRREPDVTSDRALRAIGVTATLALMALLAGISIARGSAAVSEYRSRSPLNLPGAARIRLDHDSAAELQWLVANLRAHSTAFVSLPALNSLHLWSGIPPLTRFNAAYLWSGVPQITEMKPGSWVTNLIDGEQRRIAARLLATRRPMAIVSTNRDWTGDAEVSRMPLVQTLGHEFVSSGLGTGSYDILQRRVPPRATVEDYLLAGVREFRDSGDRMAAPSILFAGRKSFSIEMRVRTTGSGVLFSLSDRTASAPRCHGPVMYVGNDGHLYAGARTGREAPALRSRQTVNDGTWHYAVLSAEGAREALRVDDDTVTADVPGPSCAAAMRCIIGSGYAYDFPAANDGWFPFRGSIASVIYHPIALTPEQLSARSRVVPPHR